MTVTENTFQCASSPFSQPSCAARPSTSNAGRCQLSLPRSRVWIIISNEWRSFMPSRWHSSTQYNQGWCANDLKGVTLQYIFCIPNPPPQCLLPGELNWYTGKWRRNRYSLRRQKTLKDENPKLWIDTAKGSFQSPLRWCFSSELLPKVAHATEPGPRNKRQTWIWNLCVRFLMSYQLQGLDCTFMRQWATQNQRGQYREQRDSILTQSSRQVHRQPRPCLPMEALPLAQIWCRTTRIPSCLLPTGTSGKDMELFCLGLAFVFPNWKSKVQGGVRKPVINLDLRVIIPLRLLCLMCLQTPGLRIIDLKFINWEWILWEGGT